VYILKFKTLKEYLMANCQFE